MLGLVLESMTTAQGGGWGTCRAAHNKAYAIPYFSGSYLAIMVYFQGGGECLLADDVLLEVMYSLWPLTVRVWCILAAIVGQCWAPSGIFAGIPFVKALFVGRFPMVPRNRFCGTIAVWGVLRISPVVVWPWSVFRVGG